MKITKLRFLRNISISLLQIGFNFELFHIRWEILKLKQFHLSILNFNPNKALFTITIDNELTDNVRLNYLHLFGIDLINKYYSNHWGN